MTGIVAFIKMALFVSCNVLSFKETLHLTSTCADKLFRMRDGKLKHVQADGLGPLIFGGELSTKAVQTKPNH